MVTTGGGWSDGLVGAAEHFFAVEGEFLALEIEGGKFLDGGEEVAQFVATRLGADELEGFLVKELADGALNAGGF